MTVVGKPENQPEPTGSTEPEVDPIETAQRAAAEAAGLDFDSIPQDEREFVLAVEINAAQASTVRGNTHPLIPGADADGNPIDPATAPATDGATTDDAGEGVARPVSDASSGGEEQDDPTGAPAAATSPAPTDPATVPPADATAPVLIEINGVQVPLEYAQYALGLAQQLSPEEIEHLNAVREGRAGFAFIDPATGQPIPTDLSGQPAPSPTPAAPEQPAEEWIDPAAQAAYARLQSEIQGIASVQQQTIEQQVASQRAAIEDALATGVEEFRTANNLETAQMDQLLTAVNAAGILPGYANLHRGNHSQAMKAALESAYWSTPQFRDAAIQAAISEHVTETRDVETKKARASSLNPSAGNVPRTSPPPSSQDERDRGMVADIAAAMQQGSQ